MAASEIWWLPKGWGSGQVAEEAYMIFYSKAKQIERSSTFKTN